MRGPTISEKAECIRQQEMPWAVKELLVAGLIVGLSSREMLIGAAEEMHRG